MHIAYRLLTNELPHQFQCSSALILIQNSGKCVSSLTQCLNMSTV